MKKFILIVTLLLVSLISFSQTYFKAYQSEIWTWNESVREYELFKKHTNLNITIVVEDESINIQAESPTMFSIDPSTKETIVKTSLKIIRYQSIELKSRRSCFIDIVQFFETGEVMLSVNYTKDGVNLRYYITK